MLTSILDSKKNKGKISMIFFLCFWFLLISPLHTKQQEKQATQVKNKSLKLAPSNTLFTGFHYKGGWMSYPEADGFGNKWILSVGYDIGLMNYLYLGAELQPYFRNFSYGDLSHSSFSTNLFIHIRGGINLGEIFRKLKFLKLQAGLGPGIEFSNTSIESEGLSGSDLNVRPAWHLVYGVEIILKKVNIILEFQTIHVAVPDISPDPSYRFVMVGIRF